MRLTGLTCLTQGGEWHFLAAISGSCTMLFTTILGRWENVLRP